MNRNKLIGTLIGKVLGYTVQGLMFRKFAEVVGSRPTAVLATGGAKYGIRFIKYTAKNYSRINCSSETIFSDSIDAILNAY